MPVSLRCQWMVTGYVRVKDLYTGIGIAFGTDKSRHGLPGQGGRGGSPWLRLASDKSLKLRPTISKSIFHYNTIITNVIRVNRVSLNHLITPL